MKTSVRMAEILAEIGKEHELGELDYEDSDVKIHIAFESAHDGNASPKLDIDLIAQMSRMTNLGLGMSSSSEALPAVAAAATPAPLNGAEEIRSPLAGVFYCSPRPNAEPFVKEGDVVAVGQVLCIVEAMKLMNEITAERPCKIVKVLVGNSQAVEEGQALFLIG